MRVISLGHKQRDVTRFRFLERPKQSHRASPDLQVPSGPHNPFPTLRSKKRTHMASYLCLRLLAGYGSEPEQNHERFGTVQSRTRERCLVRFTRLLGRSLLRLGRWCFGIGLGDVGHDQASRGPRDVYRCTCFGFAVYRALSAHEMDSRANSTGNIDPARVDAVLGRTNAMRNTGLRRTLVYGTTTPHRSATLSRTFGRILRLGFGTTDRRVPAGQHRSTGASPIRRHLGDLRELDFRFPIGAPFNGLKAFFTTPQLSWIDKLRNALALGTSPIVRGLVDYEGAMRTIRALDSVSFQDWFVGHGGSPESIRRMWNPIAYALGFIDCEAISARCMLTIFMMFAAKTEASKLNLLKGSPHRWLTGPILDYIQQRGGKLHLRHRVKQVDYSEGESPEITGLQLGTPDGDIRVEADAYLAACDVPGIQKLLPEAWNRYPQFKAIHHLEAVPVATVQLRYDGWVTELGDAQEAQRRDVATPTGLNNLLYTADADFSCFADLALASPDDYRKEGEGSLLQCVLTPGDPWIPKSVEDIVAHTDRQVRELFPSARNLKLTWSNVVKLAQSLYREAPGMEPYRPEQRTPIRNFFLAGSYTRQDYIDSMEGATMSGHLAAAAILDQPVKLATNAAVA